MKIAIIKYNAGNILSVLYALERIGYAATVTDNPAWITQADKVIFPGVGEASSAMQYLREKKLDKLIPALEQPVLGICLGMQLLCSHSEENDTACLGVFDTRVVKFSFENLKLKIPQVGWNRVSCTNQSLFPGLEKESWCYFVHSYYAGLCAQTAGVTDYGLPFSSALKKDNFYGVQFHPEKSAAAGEHILKNFLNL